MQSPQYKPQHAVCSLSLVMMNPPNYHFRVNSPGPILRPQIDQRGPADLVALLDPNVDLVRAEVAVPGPIGGKATE
jgi:hypothetical protein